MNKKTGSAPLNDKKAGPPTCYMHPRSLRIIQNGHLVEENLRRLGGRETEDAERTLESCRQTLFRVSKGLSDYILTPKTWPKQGPGVAPVSEKTILRNAKRLDHFQWRKGAGLPPAPNSLPPSPGPLNIASPSQTKTPQ